MFISFYITDAKNSLVFQYLLSSNSPPFASLWTKIQNIRPELAVNYDTASLSGDELNSNTLSVHGTVGKDLEVYKYYSSKNKLNYLCLTSGSGATSHIDPFIFLEGMDRKLLEYFDKDQLTASKLINNYDRVTMIFYTCVNGGEPAIGGLYDSKIKRAVPTRSDLSKIINSTAHSIQKAVQRQQQHNGQLIMDKQSFSVDTAFPENEVVPWRNGNVKYTNNEIYVDMTETVHVVYQKNKKRKAKHPSYQRNGTGTFSESQMEMVCGTINGISNVRCYLSGNPLLELQLDLAGNNLGVPSFHEAVELDLEETGNKPHNTSKSIDYLKFIPPDGKFRLMEYSIDLDMLQIKQRHYKYNNNSIIGLISVSFQDGLGNKNDEFEITVNISNSAHVTNIEDLQIELDLFSNIHLNEKDKDNNQNEDDLNEETDFKIKILRNTHGRFENSVIPGKGIWIFDKETPTGALPVLRGCVEYPNSRPSSHSVKLQRVALSYSHTGELASGLRVKSINISGIPNQKSLKLFKGVKYITKTGDFEIRA